jgi:hypothetical protein
VSAKAYRPERCALCGKLDTHWTHQVDAPPTLGAKLMRLFWPRWMWGHTEGRHTFVSKAARVEAADRMAKLKRRIARQRRLS